MAEPAALALYGYYRSSAAYRVRIALNLKGLAYACVPVHLLRGGGMQHGDAYKALNPQQLVPLLVDGEVRIAQSLAIVEYLDERYPQVKLIPGTPAERARVRQIALAIACDVHPLQNLRVLKYLKGPLGVEEGDRTAWVAHWIRTGFEALEAELSRDPGRGRYCVGDAPTMADCALVPQLFSADRFGVDLAPYPTLRAIREACEALPAFADAHPSRQPDSE